MSGHRSGPAANGQVTANLYPGTNQNQWRRLVWGYPYVGAREKGRVPTVHKWGGISEPNGSVHGVRLQIGKLDGPAEQRSGELGLTDVSGKSDHGRERKKSE